MLNFFLNYWYIIAGSLIGLIAFVWFWRAMRLPQFRQKLQKTVMIGAVVGLLGGGVAFWWGLNSDAYKIAKAYAEEAPESTSRFGSIRDISTRSFEIQGEKARYSFAVDGEKTKGILTLYLQKDPAWRVVRVESSE